MILTVGTAPVKNGVVIFLCSKKGPSEVFKETKVDNIFDKGEVTKLFTSVENRNAVKEDRPGAI